MQMMACAPDAQHTPPATSPAKGHAFVEDHGHHHDQRGIEHHQNPSRHATIALPRDDRAYAEPPTCSAANIHRRGYLSLGGLSLARVRRQAPQRHRRYRDRCSRSCAAITPVVASPPLVLTRSRRLSTWLAPWPALCLYGQPIPLSR